MWAKTGGCPQDRGAKTNSIKTDLPSVKIRLPFSLFSGILNKEPFHLPDNFNSFGRGQAQMGFETPITGLSFSK
jgi:hypothetical protein